MTLPNQKDVFVILVYIVLKNSLFHLKLCIYLNFISISYFIFEIQTVIMPKHLMIPVCALT